MPTSDQQTQQIIRKNTFASVLQVVITTVTMLVVYSYMVRKLGAGIIGVWSIVMASTNMVRIGELGFLGGVVKFVAKYISLKQTSYLKETILTATTTMTASLLLVALLAYLVLRLIFPAVFIDDALTLSITLLPYALFYVVLLSIGGGLENVLEGCLRTDLKSLVLVAGSSINLLLSLILLPRMGIMGLMFAQITKAVVQLIISWVLVRSQIENLPVLPFGWSLTTFKELFNYSVSFLAINISVMLFDPITKFILGAFGGLEVTGYYDMAQRIVNQVRMVLTTANRTIIPVVADFHENDRSKILTLFFKNFEIISYLVILTYIGLVSVLPVVSRLWIGQYVPIFVWVGWIILAGDFLSILSSPAYFVNQGTGDLKWNVVSHVLMLITSVILGFVLGQSFGGIGVIIGIAIAKLLSGLVIQIPFQVQYQVELRKLFPQKSILLFLYSLFLCFIGILLFHQWIEYASLPVLIGFGLSVFVLFLFGAWLHPIRKELLSSLENGKRSSNDERKS